jgi:cytochrome c553
MKHIMTSIALFAFFSSASFAIDPSASMGQGLFEQQGANSCQHCHGMTGEGGKVATAAKLTQPKTWQTYKALGGDAAFKKNPAEFKKNMEEAVVNLIKVGAIAHNSTFKKSYLDWKKIRPFDVQMLGLTGAPSASWLSKYKDRGVDKAIAAQAAYLHVQTFDKQGVFK